MQKPPRIAICHPGLGRGGSEARALWLVQALVGSCDVDLVTLAPVQLDALNAYYDTNVRACDASNRWPRVGRVIARAGRAAALKAAVFQRFVAGISRQYDLIISAYNPVRVDVPCIAFVADLSWLPSLRVSYDGETGTFDGASGLSALAGGTYHRLVRAIGGITPEAAVGPRTTLVANSAFVRTTLLESAGIDCPLVIHPPVAGPLGGPPTAERQPVFLTIGRISPEKRLNEQIDIVTGVREAGFDVGLRIYGGPTEGAYARRIQARIKELGPWARWDGWIGGPAKWDILRSAQFGIHGRIGEAFGISVAEMIRAGVIVFAPDVGGPAEIVSDDRLTFDSPESAVEKITSTLGDVGLQAEIQAGLLARGPTFGSDRFVEESRSLVETVLSRQEGTPHPAQEAL